MADRKYQKQENGTNNPNGNTNNSSKHNTNDKSNNVAGNNNKNSYENNITITTPKMAQLKTIMTTTTLYVIYMSIY